MGKETSNRNSDYFLWERFKSGDKDVLSEIYYAHYQSLYNYGLRIYNKPSFIEDGIQELFFELISKLSSLGTTDNISFYLLASFRRKVISRLKNDNTYHYSDQEEIIDQYDTEPSPEKKWIQSRQQTTYSKKLEKMIDSLSAREQEAIYLKFYQNLDYEQITEIMGVNYKSARMLIYRAIKSLREKGVEDFKDMVE